MTFSSAAASLATISTSSSVPSLAFNSALNIARGGAITSLASAATNAVVNLSTDQDDSTSTSLTSRGGDSNSSFLNLTPQGSSVLCMAIAMSLHYLSYSIARPSTIALFTSAKTGFAGNTAAFPLAMAFISPTSLCLLVLYGKILSVSGPRGAVQQTTTMCASMLWLSSLAIYTLSKSSNVFQLPFCNMNLLQLVTGVLFVFRESYVQLLTSQYWSFMASILTPDQSAKWFSPISGLTSVTSAIAGLGVSNVVEALGLPGALTVAGGILMTSLFFTERAYSISDAGGFTPSDDEMTKSKKGKVSTKSSHDDQGLIRKASGLFARVPVLKALFMEILAGQGLATLLNVCFVTKLSESLPDDAMRAGWMGKFFASINGVAMCLQFGVIPRIMPYLEPRSLWRFMPSVMVIALGFLCLNENPSLYLISGAFMLFKVMEFSIRRMLDEMVYVPLDFESRFLGKEIISVFGYRFGKSGMSLALSGLTSLFGNFGLQQLSCLTGGASCLWLAAAWNVSNRVLTRKEAEDLYQSKKGGNKRQKKNTKKK